MLILKKVTLKNFLSHSDTSLDFRENQKLLLSGRSGSGKSAIVDSIVWAFYGKGRVDNKSLIKTGKKGAKVVVELIDDSSDYLCKIERSITKTNKHEVVVLESRNGEKLSPIKTIGVRGTQEYLEKEILKSSYLLFINSIIYPQENFDTFVRQTAAKRKEIILEIINSNNYDGYLKKSKEALQDNKLQTGITESKIVDKEAQIKRDEERSANLEIYKKRKEEVKSELSLLEKEVETVQSQYDSYTERISFLRGKESLVIDTINQIALNEKKITELNKRIIEIETVDVKKLEGDVRVKNELELTLKKEEERRESVLEWQAKMNEINRSLPPQHDYESDIGTVNKKIILVMGEPVPECPKCGTKYPSFEDNKKNRVDDLTADLKIITGKKEEYEGQMVKYEEALISLGPCQVFDHTAIATLTVEINSYRESEKKLNELAGKTEIVRQLSQDIELLKQTQIDLTKKQEELSLELSGKALLEDEQKKINEQRINLIGRKQTLNSQGLENESLLAIAEDAINNIARNAKDIGELKETLGSLKNDGESLKLIKDAFSPNGIKAMVVDYVIPQLEDKINNILGKMSDFRVILETQKNGSKEETVIEGLFITIIDPLGNQLDFSSYSGGERLKITVAISEALAEIQKIGFRVLDELFIGLDEESIEGFAKVMMDLQERFSQMICISHIRDIKDIFDEKITVVKNNGTSTIKS